jgi:hypothetical protein
MAGKTVVNIRPNPSSGVQQGYDNLGNYVGKYDPKKNVTYDKEGRPVSRGNGLVGVATNGLCYKGMGAVCHPVAVVESSYRPRNVIRPIPVNPSASPRTPYRPIPAVPSSYYPRWPGRRW